MKVLLITLVLMVPVFAVADQGETMLSLNPMYLSDSGDSGTGMGVACLYGVNDFVRLGGDVQWDYVFGRGNQDVGLRFDVDLLIDAFEWVPYFRIGAGTLFPPKKMSVYPLLSAGIGLDWRPWPDYSIGVFGGIELTGTKLNIIRDTGQIVLSFYF